MYKFLLPGSSRGLHESIRALFMIGPGCVKHGECIRSSLELRPRKEVAELWWGFLAEPKEVS